MPALPQVLANSAFQFPDADLAKGANAIIFALNIHLSIDAYEDTSSLALRARAARAGRSTDLGR
jgi:hypothetical protein